MIDKEINKRATTLKEYNNTRLISDDILTGKEFRRLKRKKRKRIINY